MPSQPSFEFNYILYTSTEKFIVKKRLISAAPKLEYYITIFAWFSGTRAYGRISAWFRRGREVEFLTTHFEELGLGHEA